MFFDGEPVPSYGWYYHNETNPRSDGNLYTIYDAAFTFGSIEPSTAHPNAAPGIWHTATGFGIRARHNGMINCAFLDGHVQAMSVGMLYQDPLGLGRRQNICDYWTDAYGGLNGGQSKP